MEAVCVGFSATYNTVNHGLLAKVSMVMKSHHFTKLIQTILENRRFFMNLWKTQPMGTTEEWVIPPP